MTELCPTACSPTEIIAFSDRAKEFEKLGCQLIGELLAVWEHWWWLSAMPGAAEATVRHAPLLKQGRGPSA